LSVIVHYCTVASNLFLDLLYCTFSDKGGVFALNDADCLKPGGAKEPSSCVTWKLELDRSVILFKPQPTSYNTDKTVLHPVCTQDKNILNP
jgi:hypothetical protein